MNITDFSPSQVARFQAEMDEYQQILSQYFSKELDGFLTESNPSPTLDRAVRSAFMQGGKRLRPVLCLAFSKALGGDFHKALPYAMAVELIHSYSLVHDDIMDEDDYRRGEESCHKRFGRDIAILTGDSLQTLAFSALALAQLPSDNIKEALCLLSKWSGICGMIGGQAWEMSPDLEQSKLSEISRVHLLKTAALLRSACELGAIASETATPEIRAHIQCYAENMGLAFQIRDDILDETSTKEVLGKPVGSDKKRELPTYYSMLGQEKAQAQLENLTNLALESLAEIPNTDFIRWLTLWLCTREK